MNATGQTNPFANLSKRDLKDVMLRCLNELSNLRTDSKRYRQRLETTRSELARVQYQMAQVQDAMVRETVLKFPSPQPQKDIVETLTPAESRRKRVAQR